MNELKVGVAGLGVVGSGVAELLLNHVDRLSRAGSRLTLAGVSARDKSRDRGISMDQVVWFENPVELASSDSIDVFVELIGGASGVAHEAVQTALRHGKHVVTANKAMLAEHGAALAALAEEKRCSLLYEAAVAGGIPVIRGVREGASACRIDRLAGLLNGTCNYILTRMTMAGTSYDEALKEAQALGFAEADPAFDVGGADAAQKLAILSTIAFDAGIRYGTFPVEGIEQVTAEDISGAGKLGFRIKLLAVAQSSEGGCELRVHPALVKEDHPVAKADGADNFVIVETDPLGRLTFSGPGAGKGPTAAAVVADLVALSRGVSGPVFNAFSNDLQKANLVSADRKPSRFYLRVGLKDVPGAIAGISETLAQKDISIDSLIQPSVSAAGDGRPDAMVMLVTHETTLAEIRAAADEIRQKAFALGAPSIIRIEDFD
ncbi:homoserine dehydrogenase [Parvularcula sp. IMCC14364]|uniref:homoserine dehydrogenase n=1 Tax=Parvularcula sp. IMCC14364 TaxID=3067902 RepID=UPI0027409EA4|nr:homoserine dehydrogenase [Parvularcula sp. IMCC14364]